MKVFCLSDARCPDFMDMYAQCDVFVTTGDLDLMDMHPLLRMKSVERKPAFGVYGNHCMPGYMPRYGIVDLHNQIVSWNGLRWGGWQGCVQYRSSLVMYTEAQAKEWAERFDPVDVLLLHAGPLGLLDDPTDVVHAGSAAVRKYVLRVKPRVVFLGHQYSDADMNVGGIVLHRTYGGRLIDIP